MQTELIKELNKVLKVFPQFWNGEELHRTVVIDAINQKQPDVIKALVASDKIKSIYGTDIDGIFIFEFDKLCSLLKYKEYWENSFTKYRNKVGLTSEGKYIVGNCDVVLNFPFKDCVLEGGMTKEDQGKSEIYYNEIIARDEIDNILSKKTIIKSKLYTKNNITNKIDNFSDRNNLIIKGNNLIALHSLKYRYTGKVKLIYIDPPYNTGNDGFKYNDKFNHSSWLVFIKNRIEISRELLSDNGSIFIHCDDNEQAYLRVLMDEIFGKENFQATIINNATPNGRDYGFFAQNQDYIHVYSKNKDKIELNKIDDDNVDKYNKKDKTGPYYIHPLFNSNSNFHKDNRPNLFYPFYVSNEVNEEGYYDISLDKFENCIEVFPPKSQKDGTQFVWRWGKDKSKENINTEIVGHRTSTGGFRIVQKMRLDKKIPRTLWSNSNMSNRRGTEEVQKLFGSKLFSYPKSESLIQEIINIGSNEGDLILDFHLGSGTTAAVAHKMGRRYIGIEQMDYINEITVPRLQKVIEGEQGGISKDVGWQGGGSFVYAELMELNAYFVHEIQKAQSNEELEELFAEMKTEAHLNYQVALENVLSAEYEMDGIPRKVAFRELELHEQKQLLIEILDKNQLYVNASEMDDSDLNISESDKAFTRSFYGME